MWVILSVKGKKYLVNSDNVLYLEDDSFRDEVKTTIVFAHNHLVTIPGVSIEQCREILCKRAESWEPFKSAKDFMVPKLDPDFKQLDAVGNNKGKIAFELHQPSDSPTLG